jgi:endonuclease/exonuclease/phosphatase family metal-dependent hydrolase
MVNSFQFTRSTRLGLAHRRHKDTKTLRKARIVVMRFRVLTYNIKDGGFGREERILEVFMAVRPDMVVLEAVYEATPVGQWAAALDMSFVRVRGNTSRHLALMSRFPIESSAGFHPNPPIHTALLEATLRLNPERAVCVFGVHLLAGPFVLMELWRIWEIATILRRIKTTSPALCMIVGDFNAIAPGDPVQTHDWPAWLKLTLAAQAGYVFRAAIRLVLAAGFIDCYRQLHRAEAGFTLPAPAPNARLDYVFASPDLHRSLRGCQFIREPAAVLLASDHCPLSVEFDL